MKLLDNLCRRVFPSTAVLSYNWMFILAGRVFDFVAGVFYKEFRCLPPNHLRVRVGVGNKLFFNQVFHLDRGSRFWLKRFAANSLDLNSNILEIGCGCGRMALPLKSIGFVGHYTGIDIDDEMLDYCKKSFPRSRFSFIKSAHISKTYFDGDSEKGLDEDKFYEVPLEAGSLDFVYSTSLFTHLLELELINYLVESFRLLKTGGTMEMSFFCIDSMEVSLGGRWSFKYRMGNAYVESLKYPEAAAAYDKEYIENACKDAGFAETEFVLTSGQSRVLCRK